MVFFFSDRMLTVISPAKTLDYVTPTASSEFTLPAHLTQSRQLVKRLRQLSSDDLSQLMHTSTAISELNQKRFKKWKTPFRPDNSRQALFAFKGDVYIGLDAYSLTGENIEFAQHHLRILSGLYGLLRPLDLIQPYRLEMGTRLDTEYGQNLYQFWDDRITRNLNAQLKQLKADSLINLASNEYFKSIRKDKLKARIITPVFKDYYQGKYRIIGFFAKKARGQMTRYLIDNKVTEANALKSFDRGGYSYNASFSNDREWIFTRSS